MKKILVAAVAICMVFGLAASAMATTDVTAAGTFRVRGFFFDKISPVKSTTANGVKQYYDQRLRSTFGIAPAEGVFVKFRVDVLEKTWGGAAPAESFSVERCWGGFTTGFGTIQAGQISDNGWGTGFADQVGGKDEIRYTNAFGPVSVLATIWKDDEDDKGLVADDQDLDIYKLGGIYKWDGGQAGLLFRWDRDATTTTQLSDKYLLSPYVKASFGPLYVEAEINQYFGQIEYDAAGTADKDYEGLSYYVMLKYNAGPFYVGGLYAFCEGEDTASYDLEQGRSGSDWNPAFILFNDTQTITAVGSDLDNGSIWTVFVGASPMENLSVKATLAGATADYTAAGVDDDYGYEFDLEASYKILPNVTYSVGFGYLWSGDYFKSGSATTELEDIYVIKHQVQWSF